MRLHKAYLHLHLCAQIVIGKGCKQDWEHMYSNKYSKLDRILFESQCNKSEINICTVFAPIQCNIACWKGCHLVKMVFLEAGD